MQTSPDGSPASLERRCAVVAAALSEGRRTGARLVSGSARNFGLSRSRTDVHVPYPVAPDRPARFVTCGVALQCAPSKDVVAALSLPELTFRQRRALSIVEGGVATGWIARRWPGLLADIRAEAPVPVIYGEPGLSEIVRLTAELAASGDPLPIHPLLGELPLSSVKSPGIVAAGRRAYGRMPWSTKRRDSERIVSVPVGGDGGVRNPNLPPSSKPQVDEPVSPDRRLGVPYPEWNAWTHRFLPDHVAVLERRVKVSAGSLAAPPSPDVCRWFDRRTHRAFRGGLEDGSDLDVDRYVTRFIDAMAGETDEPRVFRELVPAFRDVATAVLLDGSSSLSVHGGRTFELELACADALSHAMTATRERHGVFVFSGNTRHRVDVACLKDFDDPTMVSPGSSGLKTGGYTRLGAPVRHLTSRLLAQRVGRRLLLIIGDGLISDEGYEGRYAWSDVAHAIDEAREAGVSVFYIGVGSTRVDPLPEVFGPRRSRRIRRVEELPKVLAQVHRELVAA